MTGLGPKIIQSLKEAIAGDLRRVTIEGVTWVRKEELDSLRIENAELRKQLMNNSPGTASDGGQKTD